MPTPDPRDVEAKAALRSLTRARTAIEQILSDPKATEFDKFTAIQRKRAILAEIDRLKAEIAGGVGKAAGQVSQDAARRRADILSKEFSVTVDAEAVASAARSAGEQMVDVSDATRRAVNRATLKVVVGQTDRAQYDQEIRKALGSKALEYRVERIARTEIGRVLGEQKAADLAAMNSVGADLIQRWVSSGKGPGRERESHAMIDGQEREEGEAFNVGQGATAETPPGGTGYEARFPNDPNLPAEESVNCGCTVVMVPREQARQSYIAKAKPTAKATAPA